MTSSPKRSLLIALILLLIGGGGAAFYLHLRMQAPPAHDELFDFLRESSPEGWKLDEVSAEVANVQTRPAWLTKLGFREAIYQLRDFYHLHHHGTGESVVLTALHKDGKISGLRFSGSSPNIETLREAIVRRFPQLRSRF